MRLEPGQIIKNSIKNSWQYLRITARHGRIGYAQKIATINPRFNRQEFFLNPDIKIILSRRYGQVLYEKGILRDRVLTLNRSFDIEVKYLNEECEISSIRIEPDCCEGGASVVSGGGPLKVFPPVGISNVFELTIILLTRHGHEKLYWTFRHLTPKKG